MPSPVHSAIRNQGRVERSGAHSGTLCVHHRVLRLFVLLLAALRISHGMVAHTPSVIISLGPGHPGWWREGGLGLKFHSQFLIEELKCSSSHSSFSRRLILQNPTFSMRRETWTANILFFWSPCRLFNHVSSVTFCPVWSCCYIRKRALIQKNKNRCTQFRNRRREESST